jgi:hypothetical protein
MDASTTCEILAIPSSRKRHCRPKSIFVSVSLRREPIFCMSNEIGSRLRLSFFGSVGLGLGRVLSAANVRKRNRGMIEMLWYSMPNPTRVLSTRSCG